MKDCTNLWLIVVLALFLIALNFAPVLAYAQEQSPRPNLVPIKSDSAGIDIKLNKIVWGYSERTPFGNPMGIYFDSRKNEVYLCDSGNNQVGVFGLDGETRWVFKHWIISDKTKSRVLGEPVSLVITKKGDIILSDNASNYLDILDYRGEPVQKINPDDYDSNLSFAGAVLALDSLDNLYVAIKTNKQEILKFSLDYQLLLRFGEDGNDSSQFKGISSVYVLPDGKILATDFFSVPALKIFDSEGHYIRGYGGHDVSNTDFSFASSITATSGGRIWIVDGIRQVAKCFTDKGEFVTMIGGYGQAPGDMCFPSAISGDGDSIIVVAEREGNRYQQFTVH